jgi:proline iminopeptidase
VLHGGPGAHHDYLLPQFLDLADEFDLLFYDQRGGGRSRTDDRTPITWETHVDDLQCVIAELAPGAPTLVGYSWGGLLALLYALQAARGRATPAPARLALIDPAPVSRAFRAQFEAEFARRQQGPEIARLRDELAQSGLREADPGAYRHRTFELSVAPYFADPRQAANLTPFRVTGRVQDSVWASLGQFDLLPDLHLIRCATLVVHGRQDPIPIASSETVAKAMAASLVALDGCGHVPYVERRVELFSALRAFLRDAASPHPSR